MFEHYSCDNIERDAQNQEIPWILSVYRAAMRHDGWADYALFNAESLRRFGDAFMVLEAVEDDDFRYLHYGASIIQHAGHDVTGQRLSMVVAQQGLRDLGREVGRSYLDALSQGRPLLTRHRALRSHVSLWERLICPTRTEDGRRLLVVFMKPAEFRIDLLTTILDSAPMGVMAFRAQRDRDGAFADARLVTVNQNAADFLQLAQDELVGAGIADLSRFKIFDGMAERYARVIETQTTDHYDAQLTGLDRDVWLRLTIAPWNDGFIAMFMDITELKLAQAQLERQARALRFEVGVEKASRQILSAQLESAAELEKELRAAADHDSLTGILNRRGFDCAVEAALKADGVDRAHMLLIDIDHFKSINDRWGHSAGDEVLKTFAARLTTASSALGAIAARIGGEEFALYVKLEENEEADATFGALHACLTEEPAPLGNGLAAPIACSIGFAALSPGETLNACLERADVALYDAKRFGRNRVTASQATVAAA